MRCTNPERANPNTKIPQNLRSVNWNKNKHTQNQTSQNTTKKIQLIRTNIQIRNVKKLKENSNPTSNEKSPKIGSHKTLSPSNNRHSTSSNSWAQTVYIRWEILYGGTEKTERLWIHSCWACVAVYGLQAGKMQAAKLRLYIFHQPERERERFKCECWKPNLRV